MKLFSDEFKYRPKANESGKQTKKTQQKCYRQDTQDKLKNKTCS